MTSEIVQTVVNTPHTVSKPRLIDTVQLAEYLGNEVNTCEGWRLKGIGPSFIKVGRLVRYNTQTVELWIESQTRNSTSEA